MKLLLLLAALALCHCSSVAEDVHVVTTLCGKSAMADAAPMLRSLLWFKSAKVVVHAIADEAARANAENEFRFMRSPHAELRLINSEEHSHLVKEALGARGEPASEKFACRALRLFAPQLLPDEVATAIALPSEGTVVVGDVMDLWAHSRHFNKNSMFGAALEQTHAYRVGKAAAGSDWDVWSQVFETHGIDGSVMLLNLEKLRKKGWKNFLSSVLKSAAFTSAPASGKGSLEQDAYNYALLKHGKRSKILYKLPCTWNVNLHPQGLCTNMNKPGVPRFNCTCMSPKIMHGDKSSLRKSKLGSFYSFWKDSPPQMDYHFIPRPADERHGEPLVEHGAGPHRYDGGGKEEASLHSEL